MADTQREPNLEEWIGRELKHSLVRREYESLKEERDKWKETAEAELKVRNIVLDVGEQKLTALKQAAAKVVGLLNSMVEGKESHSEQSRKAVSDFFALV